MAEYKDPSIRLTLLPRDTNAHGTIFGGIILSYIDMAGATEARRHTQHERFVTIAMREVIFHKPVFVGDLVSFYCDITKVGKTSVTVKVTVEAERDYGTDRRVEVTEAEVVYVAVDAERNKVELAPTKFNARRPEQEQAVKPDEKETVSDKNRTATAQQRAEQARNSG